MPARLHPKEVRTVRAVAEVLVGEDSPLCDGSADLGALLDAWLSGADRDLVLGTRLILHGMDLWCRLRHFCALYKLPRARRERFLRRWKESHWYLRRISFKAVAALVYFAHYSRPEVAARLGYRPTDNLLSAGIRREDSAGIASPPAPL